MATAPILPSPHRHHPMIDLDETAARLAFIRVESCLLATRPELANAATRRDRLERMSHAVLRQLRATCLFRMPGHDLQSLPRDLVCWPHDLCAWHVAHHGRGTPKGLLARARERLSTEPCAQGLDTQTLDRAWTLGLTAVRADPGGLSPDYLAYWPQQVPTAVSFECATWVSDSVLSRSIRHDY